MNAPHEKTQVQMIHPLTDHSLTDLRKFIFLLQIHLFSTTSMSIFYSLVLLFCGATAQEYVCGRSKLSASQSASPDQHIVGGTDSVPGMLPWTLSLERFDEESGGFELQCGAVLIDPLWAVTGARCLDDDIDMSMYQVVAGQLNRSEETGMEQYINIAEIYIHPEFNGTERNYPNDIALLQLAEAADIETEERPIYPICLPPSGDTRYWENPQCFITGYGLIDHDTRELPEYLQQAWMEAIRPANCDVWWDTDEEGREILDTHQCVYDQVDRSVSICHNDNGGPLSCMVDARFDLAAVGSFYQHGCNGRFPSIYTSVPQYLEWIVAVSGVQPRQPDQ